MYKKINLNTDEKYIPDIKNAEAELRYLCEKQAIELYGEIPQIINAKLEWEINSLKMSNHLALMLIFGRLLQSNEFKPYMIKSKGILSSSIVSYLLNITKANPLPPHYRCKCGNYYNFDTKHLNVSVGSDLPSKLCPVCGKKLIKDGFNLHNEFLFGLNGEKKPYIELNISKSKKYPLAVIIEKMSEIVAVIDLPALWITDEMVEHFENFYMKLIIPSYVKFMDVYTLPQNYDMKTYLNKAYPFYTFSMNNNDSLDWLIFMEEISEKAVEKIIFEETNILHIFSETAENKNILDKEIKDIIPECNPLTISECIKTEALSYNHLWQNIGKKIIESGKAKLNELPSTIEDVYEALLNKGLPTELSFDITQVIYKGKGLNVEQQKLLSKYGMPEWFIEFCNNVPWLFSRAHIAEGFVFKNKLEYFRCNYPKAFSSVVNFKKNFDGVTGYIPNGIKTLSCFFFRGCKSLKNVVIPDSVVVIDDFAFSNCKNLTSLKIPASVEKIGRSAFAVCDGLNSVIIPSSVKEIGNDTFGVCTNLEKVTIENGLKKIGELAFNFCKKLSEVTIPDSVEEIGERAFADCESFKKIIIPKSVVKIGEGAFGFLDSEPIVTIYCEQGSYAEQYARENNISFKLI